VRGRAAAANPSERVSRADRPLTLPSPHYVGRGFPSVPYIHPRHLNQANGITVLSTIIAIPNS
jgi:hypothetical protein